MAKFFMFLKVKTWSRTDIYAQREPIGAPLRKVPMLKQFKTYVS